MDDLEVHYSGFRTSHIHNLSDLVQQNLGAQVRKFGRLQLSDTTDDSSNILVFQILGRISFRTDVAFISGTSLKDSRLKERLNSLTGTLLTSQLDEKEKEFDDKFKKCFNLADELDSESISTGKAAVASLLGGIGYFYGQSKISVPSNSNWAIVSCSLKVVKIIFYIGRLNFIQLFLADLSFHEDFYGMKVFINY
ncbi:hypothetical protein ACSBR1_036967 [Camellia fascicularis]